MLANINVSNTIDLVLKPIQLDRKLVKFIKKINKLINKPIRFQNVNLSTRIVETQYILEGNETITQISKLEGRIATRIETYENKQVVLVFTNVDNNYLKPFHKVKNRNVN
jgi:hypothetical protein